MLFRPRLDGGGEKPTSWTTPIPPRPGSPLLMTLLQPLGAPSGPEMLPGRLQLTLQACLPRPLALSFFTPAPCHTHTYTIPPEGSPGPFLLLRGWSSCVGGAHSRQQCTWTSGIWSQIPPLALALCQAFHTMSWFLFIQLHGGHAGGEWVMLPKGLTLFVLHFPGATWSEL